LHDTDFMSAVRKMDLGPFNLDFGVW
jgi:hypothetical protein